MAGREGRLKSTERPRSQGPLLRANGSSSLPMGNWNHSKLPSCGMKRVKLSITCVIFAYHEMLPTYRFTCLSLNTLRLSASIKCLSIRYEQMPYACTCLPVQVSVITKSVKNRKKIYLQIFSDVLLTIWAVVEMLHLILQPARDCYITSNCVTWPILPVKIGIIVFLFFVVFWQILHSTCLQV